MDISLCFSQKDRSVAGYVSGWVWEKANVYRLADHVVSKWCDKGAVVGAASFLGLRVKVRVSGVFHAIRNNDRVM
ncbi:hypothetical protein [Cedecea davisae]|uniref:hypothetical protein n=1 Tax=Cedecea davisae TaxID=158484 RepID=UPI00242D0DA6|nr:hypothetical protein [Cedecea davisae]